MTEVVGRETVMTIDYEGDDGGRGLGQRGREGRGGQH